MQPMRFSLDNFRLAKEEHREPSYWSNLTPSISLHLTLIINLTVNPSLILS